MSHCGSWSMNFISLPVLTANHLTVVAIPRVTKWTAGAIAPLVPNVFGQGESSLVLNPGELMRGCFFRGIPEPRLSPVL